MSKNSSNFMTFVIGAAVGVAAGIYLNSQNGKKMRKEAAKAMTKMEANLEEKVKKAYQEVKEKVNETAQKLSKSSEKVENASRKVEETSNRMANAATAGPR